MAPDYFPEYEGSGRGPALPTPAGMPYETPPFSRRSSRPGTSPARSSPSPTLTDDGQAAGDGSTDESISLLDPRRFTPTLHANLVSEILSLRRDLESKHKYIEELEGTLDTSKIENDSLARRLSQSTKDGRSVKRQFQQLEHGTLSALEELAKDRDEQKRTADDLKEKAERLETKIRSQDEFAARTQALHDRDKEAWEAQKRIFERRVHVSEARLKSLLAELAAEHTAGQLQQRANDSEEETRDSGLGNDSDTNSVQSAGHKHTPSQKARHVRDMSSASQQSLNKAYRFSTQSEAGKGVGVSLAEELDFDGEDEEGQDEIEEDENADSPEYGARARRSLKSESKAKRLLGLGQDGQTLPTVDENGSLRTAKTSMIQSPEHEAFASRPSDVTKADAIAGLVTRWPSDDKQPGHVDAAVQLSKPPSPEVDAYPDSMGTFYDDMNSTTDSVVHSRIQSVANPYDPEAINLTTRQIPVVMVSASVQTAEDPLSPPATPKVAQMPSIAVSETPTRPEAKKPVVETMEMATQTDPIEGIQGLGESPVLQREHRPAPLLIPSIAIHPASAPPSPRETMLPPGTKNVSTQTKVEELTILRSIAIQTDEIRVDRRLMQLPPHLRPSAIHSVSGSPEASVRDDADDEENADVPTATPKQLSEKTLGKSPLVRPGRPKNASPPARGLSDAVTDNRYPGNNDNGPLRPGMKEHGLRRPFRSGSLFAGFESDDRQRDMEDEIPDIKSAPVPYSTPSFPRRNLRDFRDSLANRKPPTPVPEDKEVTGRSSTESARQRANARVAKRQPSIRRTIVTKAGTNANPQRPRSPSTQSGASSQMSNHGPVKPPPFPIPNRASSKKLFSTSRSDGASSPTRRGQQFLYTRRNAKGQYVARQDSLRKVKSAAVMPRRSGERSRSGSPPAPPRDSGPPPMPQDAITRTKHPYPAVTMHRTNDSQYTSSQAAEPEEGGQATVIDAIAATMVGEWMWKYVRKRKSFNVGDSQEDFGRTADGLINVTGNGVRHKRWVWISPYERCVMWSSKQPASGTALLGKSGRKLTIQSVLDVKDDTPLPKNSSIQPSFNRSILVLTPARALKFTAVSQERHYLWLTALSFLAHANVGAPELAAIQQPPGAELGSTQSSVSAFGRRPQIRDSVRLTKAKRPSELSSLSSQNTGSRKGGLLGQSIHAEQPIPEAADAPSIPLYNNHGRKRSMTGPRIPPAPASMRNFTSPRVTPHSNTSFGSSLANEPGFLFGGRSQPPSLGGGTQSGTQSGTHSNLHSPRPSEGTTVSSRTQYIDPLGTVRMEAFVAPRRGNNIIRGGGSGGGSGDGMNDGPTMKAPRPVGVMGRSRGNTQWSSSSGDPRRSGLIMLDEFDAFDPFKGF